MGNFYHGLVGGILTVVWGIFSLLDLSGGTSRRRPDLSGGASFSSLYKCFHKFHLKFLCGLSLCLENIFFLLKSILYYCFLIHS